MSYRVLTTSSGWAEGEAKGGASAVSYERVTVDVELNGIKAHDEWAELDYLAEYLPVAGTS